MLSSGHIDIFALYSYAASNSRVPSNRSEVRAYSPLLRPITDRVPEMPGWYAFGKLDAGEWTHVYIGKTNKTAKGYGSLRARIHEELRDERAFIWMGLYGRELVLSQFPMPADEARRRAHEQDMTRHSAKQSANFVAWVSVDDDLADVSILAEERLLIEHFKPIGNKDRRRHEAGHSSITDQIFARLDAEIDLIRRPRSSS